jgi:hypothetical protein
VIGQIKQTFTAVPDAHSGNGDYQKYDMSDAALSAFCWRSGLKEHQVGAGHCFYLALFTSFSGHLKRRGSA